jgi:hypothetical protein
MTASIAASRTCSLRRSFGDTMDIRIEFAAEVVDRFEELMLAHGVSIPRHPQTHADMLPLSVILKFIKNNENLSVDLHRALFTAGVAVHDLASKVIEVKDDPQFQTLVPHLKLLVEGAIHLTQEPPSPADGYNKLIELYWACLCIRKKNVVALDDPFHADGTNPDVMTLNAAGEKEYAYAFKTVRSKHTQSLLGHIVKGVDQIERSAAREGIVALHITPRLNTADLWPAGAYFADYRLAGEYVRGAMITMVSQVVWDNGQAAVDAIFSGKKAVGTVLCISFVPMIAAHPKTLRPTFMPFKVPVLVNLATNPPVSPSFYTQIEEANEGMQYFLG